MSGATPMARLRVKSRTGDVYVRAGHHWPADRWARVEVPLDIALRLHDDPWLDVRDLSADAEVDAADGASAETPPTLERDLADAHARLAQLEERLRNAELQHARELEQLRDTHARELSAMQAATPSRTSRRA